MILFITQKPHAAFLMHHNVFVNIFVLIISKEEVTVLSTVDMASSFNENKQMSLSSFS